MSRLLFNLRNAVDRLRGRTVFESPAYREAELTRLLNLFAHIDVDEWRGLPILEVGAGLGHIGDALDALGFDVTSSDGRVEHVERIRRRGRKAFVLDLEGPDLSVLGEYDVIIAFGVLYHLSTPERFLRECGRAVRTLALETCVMDSFESMAPIVQERRGWRGRDQALSGRGCRPTPSWIEQTCRTAGFDEVRDISSPLGNWVIGKFDWEPRGTGEWRRDGKNLRKMWILRRRSQPVGPGEA